MNLKNLLRFFRMYIRSRRALRWSRDTLTRMQHAGVRRLVRQILPRSPLYNSLIQELNITSVNDFYRLPVVDKPWILDRFADWNVFGLGEEEARAIGASQEQSRNFAALTHGMSVGLSSGTTGRRGIFLTSPDERAAWAGAVLGKFLPGFWRTKHRIALFLRANSPLYETLGSSRVHFEYFDMYRPIADLMSQLQTFSPTVLFAPPQMLLACASHQAAGTLNIHPQKVVSGAEVLDSPSRIIIENAFGVRVEEIYQASEGFIAFTCSHGSLHLNEDNLIVEREIISIRDGTTRFFPIITDVYRSSQPIVRYRLNDVLVSSETPCACGCALTRILGVEGREDDVFALADAHGTLRPVFPDFIRRCVHEADPGLEHWQLVQSDKQHVLVYCAGRLDADAVFVRIVESLTKLLNSLQLAIPEFEPREYLPPTPGQKMRRVKRDFPLPAGFWQSSAS